MAFRYLHVSTNSFIQVAFLLNSAGPWQYLFLFGERKANNLKTRNTLVAVDQAWVGNIVVQEEY